MNEICVFLHITSQHFNTTGFNFNIFIYILMKFVFSNKTMSVIMNLTFGKKWDFA